jgi:hypothetical protein
MASFSLFAEPSYLSPDTQEYKVYRKYQSIIISRCWYCGEQIRHQKFKMGIDEITGLPKKSFSRTIHGPCMHLHNKNKRRKLGRYGV